MKKNLPIDEKLVVKMMNMFDAKVIAYSSKEEASRPEIRARLIEQAVDEALSLKNQGHLVNREAYIKAVAGALFREGKIAEVGEEAYLEIIKGAKASEYRLPPDIEVGIKNK